MLKKKVLLKLKEEIFLYLFLYGIFDLKIMKNLNIIFDTLISRCEEWKEFY